jgi:site-specific recombinase XerD
MFVGYPLTSEGINAYLNSLTFGNAKHNYYRCIRTLCRWQYHTDQIATKPVEKVLPPRRQKKILPAISKEQLDTIISYCHCERDKAILNLLLYSGMRVSECSGITAKDFNWGEGTVIVLGKGNRYRKALAGHSVVKKWFSTHDSFEITTKGITTMIQSLSYESGIKFSAHALRRGMAINNLKQGLSTRIVQALGGWESITMVERYSKSLSFNDALQVYHNVNGSSLSHD